MQWQQVGAVELADWMLRLSLASLDSTRLPRRHVNVPTARARHVDAGARTTTPSLSTTAIRLTTGQAIAADRALQVLHERRGVLLADRVGEGKTFIAIALIEAMLAGGARRILVTGPAALRQQWSPLLRRASAAHGARLARADRRPDGIDARAPLVTWLSHSMLSLRRWPDWLEPCDLVVVDEAHAMRNPRAQRYRSLAWLCRAARVVLLTATPINNSLLDLYHQLRLFIGDGRLADLGVPDLGAAMRSAVRAGGRVRPPLDTAIAAVVVRQPTGIDSAASVRGSRPRRVVPSTIDYDLEADAPGLVGRVLGTIQRLDLAPFGMGPATGLAGPAGRELLRFGLVKRFDSGPAALLSSLYRLAEYLDGFADAAAAGYHLRPGGRRGASSRHDPAQLVLAPLTLQRLGPATDQIRLVSSARTDASALRRIVLELEKLDRPDPKTAELIRFLSGPLSRTGSAGDVRTRKVLLFSEYRDTAVDLWKSLRTRFRVGLIHGGGAFIGDGAARRLDVVRRFLPGHSLDAETGVRGPTLGINRVVEPKLRVRTDTLSATAHHHIEEIDVLIATDVLAEGFNLQGASHVISFDMPWNPVRLLQRAGRIDRFGSPHAVVYCHTFAPHRAMDRFLGLADRIRTKLDVIHNAMSDATQVATMRRTVLQPPRLSSMGETLQRMAQNDAGLFEDIETSQLGFLKAPAPVPGPARRLPSKVGVEPRFAHVRLAAEPAEAAVESRSHDRSDDASDSCWIVMLASGGETRFVTVRPAPDALMTSPDPTHARAALQRIIADGGSASGPFRAAGTIGTGREHGDTSREARPTAPSLVLSRDYPGAVAAVVAAMQCDNTGPPGELAEEGTTWFDAFTSPVGVAAERVKLIRGLLKLVAGIPGGPDERLCRQADRVLDHLRAGVGVGVESRLAAVLRRNRGAKDCRRVLHAFEQMLGGFGDDAPAAGRTGIRPHPPRHGSDGSLTTERGESGIPPARRVRAPGSAWRPLAVIQIDRVSSGRPAVARESHSS